MSEKKALRYLRNMLMGLMLLHVGTVILFVGTTGYSIAGLVLSVGGIGIMLRYFCRWYNSEEPEDDAEKHPPK